MKVPIPLLRADVHDRTEARNASLDERVLAAVRELSFAEGLRATASGPENGNLKIERQTGLSKAEVKEGIERLLRAKRLGKVEERGTDRRRRSLWKVV